MSGRRLADQAYSGIVEYITSQKMSVGDRLPAETQLAEMFGISRTIVREALVRLASDGITEARRGSGSFVKNKPSDRLIAYTGNLSAALGTYEVRFVLETEAARLAAMRRSEHDMMNIEESMGRLRHALMTNAPAHHEDMELHRQIALATANPTFMIALDALREQVDKIMQAGVDISRSRSPDIIGAMLREHEAIVDAIRVRDADSAALAMRWHLAEGRKRLMP
ncbi:DNA-binding FadR family transcriptional regulator [Rhizomicrobium palustre]|jgi:DNA-binding FadR family transcriptional regulator|uniref:DNA-binding FadR family transcriptional regulator n=1 Tax=Rhizomicrobium palustre TaxID=189966 RepID=A0A846MZI8_9PROT|nr:FadR/GntR family transcriptional regulator [Rhizomicrobium palustre]NIK88370.1 DNA-binding FadR family transcriptional regulator [Rhizomicrobium palustre]